MLSVAMQGPLPLMFLLVAFAGGFIALLVTPREEEPQIIVPLADVLVAAPGLGAEQVERQIATPLEKILYQIDGVEYVYSMSRPGQCVVTVRFFVGEDRVDSLVKIYNKLYSEKDRIPSAVRSWAVKPVEIDDVPIIVAVLWSDEPDRTGDHELRRLAEEIEHDLQSITNTNKILVRGGRPRRMRVELDPEALAARGTAPLDVAWAIQVSNRLLPAGAIQAQDREIVVEAGKFIQSADELRDLVINVVDGVPVYLKDVARVMDGPAEPTHYTWIGFGPADGRGKADAAFYPAVAISIAKKKGSNAVWVAGEIEDYFARLKQNIFPPEVHYRIIRNHGKTADDKINNLVSSLFAAVLTVTVFIGIFLGWRAALVVGLAVPVCYGVTLLLGLYAGYTINRVTLFALILALGLLVDDPITGVDNIERYMKTGRHPGRRGVILAMGEIRSALIMSTVAIIISFAPLYFITGMMGPYMAPMAFNVPVAVTVSTVVAFLVTPWLSYKLLKPAGTRAGGGVTGTGLYRIYAALLKPLFRSPARSWCLLFFVLLLCAAAMLLPAFQLVPLKLLPYDNKDEFQVVIDMPEGTTLERTQGVAAELCGYLSGVAEVKDYTAFVGLPSPMDFNGMVRHYYLRDGAHYADIRVTLAERRHRSQQSHAMLLRLRRDLEAIAEEAGARIKLVEAPPGPPVISTIAVELYGEKATPYDALQQAAKALAARLEKEPFVVDVDTSVEDDQQKITFVPDREKAALSGISTEDIAMTVRLAGDGLVAGTMQIPDEVNPLPVVLRLPYEVRSSPNAVAALRVKGRPGITKIREKSGLRDAPQPIVPIGELGEVKRSLKDKAIYHKNLRPVAYVFADVAGRTPAEIVLDVSRDMNRPAGNGVALPVADRTYFNPGGGIPWTLPAGIRAVWDGEGEWGITLRVFRDLGIAFGVALLGIFLVLRIQTGLSAITGLIMLAIPLSIIGVMPGFWLLNHLGERAVDGFPNPVLFTATAMIGMIALAGIVVRNSLILVEFIHKGLREGMALQEALLQAGAVRMRPIFLTAGTTLLGNMVITLDPVFSGLAWTIIFGIAASTLFTLVVIPVLYHLAYGKKPGHGLPSPRETEA
ncbi:MAG: efflux RND transporter permease subunit [Deltaproteobacteria bacterium]|nr:efflux RND transporter permease subunit [Deltaproteobacteria bacterium]MBW2283078.1 efflux RND transporter permease subunit [Deltaproteobacteria bacterium]